MDSSYPVRVFPKETLPNNAHSDEKLFVLTDIHGSLSAMRRLLAHKPDDARLVFLGDAVDRGPNSLGVLEILQKDQNAVLLMGNHDIMCRYAFLGVPGKEEWYMERLRSLWIRDNGGRFTLQEFVGHNQRISEAFLAAHNANPLFESVYTRMQKFWKSGDLCFVHGGLARGSEDAWLEKNDFEAFSLSYDVEEHWAWYRPDDHEDGYFDTQKRVVHGEPVYIVCGHTPQHHARLIHNYGLFLDTGYTLKTAALIEGDRIQLMMTPCDEVRRCPEDIWDIF
ncbi:MAG: serine/threonine protein phosphatase [Lachnospiraceae bacterium]|nr:serine/threonine protein phosphatase [Lachnospiraceae bacterium]